jgi:hypothetical protein
MPRKSLIADLILDNFGLPETFPPEMMPDAARQFVADAIKGMTAANLLQMAQARGFSPLWKPLPHMVEGDVFGLGLDVGGMQVPLMVKMVRIAKSEQLAPAMVDYQTVDERQLSLLY